MPIFISETPMCSIYPVLGKRYTCRTTDTNIIYPSSIRPQKLIISQLTSQGMFHKIHFWEGWLAGNFNTRNFSIILLKNF